ncbi:MAG: hypothetical protein IAE81_04255 [Caldilineaceae bacterium]|jgi:hypothetical protein|nr:hypothetical protein [Caldilineaceae bacterium]
MNTTLRLRIGETRLSLEIGRLPAATLDDLERRYAAFAEPDMAALPGDVPPFHLAIRMRPGAPFLPWRAHTALPLRTRRVGRFVLCQTPNEAGCFDLTKRCGRVTLRPAGNVENCLRVLVGWDAAQRGGLLLHASGVLRKEGAFVFFGPSGAGKSTVARLSASWPVLSDDLVLIERVAGGYLACGAPFRGNEWTAPRLNCRAPLTGLLALEQAPHHARLPLPPSAGAARLVAATPFVTTCPHGAALVLASALALTAATPVARLQFRKDKNFWEVLHA